MEALQSIAGAQEWHPAAHPSLFISAIPEREAEYIPQFWGLPFHFALPEQNTPSRYWMPLAQPCETAEAVACAAYQLGYVA